MSFRKHIECWGEPKRCDINGKYQWKRASALFFIACMKGYGIAKGQIARKRPSIRPGKGSQPWRMSMWSMVPGWRRLRRSPQGSLPGRTGIKSLARVLLLRRWMAFWSCSLKTRISTLNLLQKVLQNSGIYHVAAILNEIEKGGNADPALNGTGKARTSFGRVVPSRFWEKYRVLCIVDREPDVWLVFQPDTIHPFHCMISLEKSDIK